MPELRTKLILKLSSPDALAPCAGAQRVSSLYHELLDHPVEDVPVEVGVPRVHAEVLHGLGTLLGEELQVDSADVYRQHAPFWR